MKQIAEERLKAFTFMDNGWDHKSRYRRLDLNLPPDGDEISFFCILALAVLHNKERKVATKCERTRISPVDFSLASNR